MNGLHPLTRLVQKRTEGIQKYPFHLLRDDKYVRPDLSHTYKAVFCNDESVIKIVELDADESTVTLDSLAITDLSTGIYYLEIWEEVNSKLHAIYPSKEKPPFYIYNNALDLPNGTVSSMTLDAFVAEFKKRVGQGGGSGSGSGTVDASIDLDKRTITIGDTTIDIPENVDLSPYLTKNDAGMAFAKKEEVPQVSLNIAQRTIEINGVKLNIPPVIDTSSFALKAEVPTVSLDLSSRIIYIGTQSIKIPNEVDLSEYYTKAQVDAAFNNHKIDLTGYLTIADADSKYVANERFKSAIDKLQKQITTSGGTSMGEGSTILKSIRPSSLRTVWGEHTYLLFDNGAKFHLGENENNRSKLWGNFYDNGDPSKVDFTWNSPYGMTGFQAQPVGSFLTAYMHGIIRLSDLSKKGTGEYWSYHNSYIENPVQNTDEYIWDAAHVSSDKVAGEPELSFIKCLYGTGMLSDEEALSIGAVKR